MEIESVNVQVGSSFSVVEAKWRNETIIVRGNTMENPINYQVLVLGFLRGGDTQGIRYEFEPISKKLQKNCRAFMRGSLEFNRGWSSPGKISFAPGYETVSTEWRGDKRVRVN